MDEEAGITADRPALWAEAGVGSSLTASPQEDAGPLQVLLSLRQREFGQIPASLASSLQPGSFDL